MEIDYGVTKTGMLLRDYLQMMKDEGLGSIPRHGAEYLDDRVRKELIPKQIARRAMGGNHYHRSRTGHSHDFDNDVRARGRARRLGAPHSSCCAAIQKRTGGFNRICPAGIHSRKDAPLPPWWEQGPEQNAKNICACTRCTCVASRGNKNLQVSWVKLGFETSLACLQAGATISAARSWKRAFQKLPAQLSENTFRRKNFVPGFARLDESQWNDGPRLTKFGAYLTSRNTMRWQRRLNFQCSSRKPSDLHGRRLLSDSHASPPLPVKDLHNAKKRLTGVLTPEERFALAEVMLADTIRAVRGVRRADKILS